MTKVETKKYYKTVEHLSIAELICYGMALGYKTFQTESRKLDLILRIIEKEPGFLDNVNKKFFFTKKANKLTFEQNPSSETDYNQEKLSAQNMINISEVNKLLIDIENVNELDTSKIKEEPTEETNTALGTQISSVDGIPNLISLLQNMSEKPEKNFSYRQKLKYEPSHGIEAFIRSVESYAEANEIKSNEKKVAIAKAALNTSEDGLLLQDALSPAEEKDWKLFKSKLLQLLGNPPDYYRDLFRSFRRGAAKLGLAMSRLTQAYKRGFLTTDQNLSENDKMHIKLQFIASLDNPLKGLVKAEEKTLTFDNIAERAAELERCYGRDFHPEGVAALLYPESRVQMVNAVNEQKSQEALNTKMIELLTACITQGKEQHEQMLRMIKNSGEKHGNFKERKPLTSDQKAKLQGYCLRKIKTGKCWFKSCKFNHGDAPESVRKHFM